MMHFNVKNSDVKICSEILNAKVHEEELLVEKVTKLGIMIKESKNKLVKIMFEYEVKVSELKITLQPIMPSEVHEKREIDLTL